jgi:ketosteroid isomerase-like protein
VAEHAIEIFNREFAAGRTGVSDETRDSWVAEPLIVPFRAALEGNEYSGPSALDDFAAETRESWEWVKIDVAEIRELDQSRALVIGDLVGRGRETGAEARATLAWIFVVREGRIAEARTFPGEREALEAPDS